MRKREWEQAKTNKKKRTVKSRARKTGAWKVGDGKRDIGNMT